jgi:hypothetical protein
MALTQITEGNTSSANDLNQVVNLLNGTTTNTQVTVNGPISAQLSPAPAPLRYVGGRKPYPYQPTFNFEYFTFSDAPFPTDFDGQGQGLGTYYQNGDLSWVNAGGPIGVYNYVPLNGLDSTPTGVSGYVCRIHQAAAVSVSTSLITYVTGDTVDFDPRGMVKPSMLGSGIAIQIPFDGIWGIAGAIHGSGVNSMNVSWFITGINTTGPFGIQISAPADNTHKYTGTYFCAFMNAGPGMQLAYSTLQSAPAAFNVDVSAPDRTYLSVWHVE